MSDTTNVAELRPSPAKGEGLRPKDATAALRAKRYRKRKSTVTVPAPYRQKGETEKRKDIRADATLYHGGGRAIDVTAYVAAIALGALQLGSRSEAWSYSFRARRSR